MLYPQIDPQEKKFDSSEIVPGTGTGNNKGYNPVPVAEIPLHEENLPVAYGIELEEFPKLNKTSRDVVLFFEIMYFVASYGIFIALLVITQSYFYYLYLIFITVDFIFFLYYFVSNHNKVEIWDPCRQNIGEIIPLVQTCYPAKQTDCLPKTSCCWYTWRTVNWLLMIFLWMRAGIIYYDVVGTDGFLGIISFSQQSSCTNLPLKLSTTEDTCQATSLRSIVYNPEGKFPHNNLPYDPAGIYANCYLDQKWALPPINTSDIYLIGYNHTGGQIPSCADELNGGIISVDNCPNQGQKNCNHSFPSKAWGLDIISTGGSTIFFDFTQPNTSYKLDYCPGNNGGTFGDNIESATKGDANPICPYCLWYWMSVTAKQPNGLPFNLPDPLLTNCHPSDDPTQWIGSTKYSIQCALCPGRGYGPLGIENYDENTLNLGFWFTTTLSYILPGTRFLASILTIIILRAIANNQEQMRKRN